MKICSICKQEKDLALFNKNKTKRDGYSTICRECSRIKSRAYYNDNREKHKVDVYKRNRKNRDLIRTKVFEYLSTHPCIDCGETDPIVLEFDHRDDSKKYKDISTLVSQGYKLETVFAEINKCDVRCANCHRRKTAIQFGWYKFLNKEQKV